jgi:spermidine/putrescine transport system ATP-binding protein
MIAGFEIPDTGRVLMDGADISHVPPNRRDVRTVFQSYALFPHLTVQENVEYSLRMLGASKAERLKKGGEALDMVDLSTYASRLPHQLSGGQRQRVALARAIVCRPKVLLLDEPLGALDLRLRQQMQHTLVALQKELGIAFVYVTHDQGEALSMSNRIAIMRDGQIAQLGTSQELYFAPVSEFVAQFVGRSNLMPINFEPLNGHLVANFGGMALPEIVGAKAGPARLALRFEAVSILPEGAASASDGLSGVVEDVLFLGTNLEVNVRVGEMNIIASVPTSRDSSYAAGQPVRVHFDLGNARVFND